MDIKISGIPFTDPAYYASITKDQLAHVLRSDSDYDMPLFEERLQVLQEAGANLLQKFGGTFENVIKECDKSAQNFLEIVTRNFPSYRCDLLNFYFPIVVRMNWLV